MAEQVGIERVAGTVVAEQDKTNLAAVVIEIAQFERMQARRQRNLSALFEQRMFSVVINHHPAADTQDGAVVGSERKGIDPGCRNVDIPPENHPDGPAAGSRTRETDRIDDTTAAGSVKSLRNADRVATGKTAEVPIDAQTGFSVPCTAPQKLDTFGVFFMKYNYEIRLKAVKLVLEGGLSVREAGCHLGCGRSQVHLWVTLFERHGLAGLKLRHGSYSAEFKLSVLKHMHQNHLSLLETAVHFGIPGPFVIRQWERLYQNQGAEGLRRKPQRRRPAMSKSKTKKVKLKTTPHEELLKELEYLRAENAYLKKLQALVEERIVRESGKEPKPSKD